MAGRKTTAQVNKNPNPRRDQRFRADSGSPVVSDDKGTSAAKSERHTANRKRKRAAGVGTAGKPTQAAAGPRRRREKRGKSNKTLYYLLFLTFVVAVGYVLSTRVFFKIEDIEVVGTDKYKPDDIIATSGIVKGENLFRIPTAEIREKILAEYPYLNTVEVRRRLPPRVELAVTQCTPTAALIEGEKVTLITREGKVLEQGLLMVPGGVPVVKGISPGATPLGEILGEECAEKLDMLDSLYSALQETEFGEITNVDLTDRLNMRIVYENRFLLELGTELELVYKLKFIKEVIETKLEPDEQGILDASNAKENRLVFKPRDISGSGDVQSDAQGDAREIILKKPEEAEEIEKTAQ